MRTYVVTWNGSEDGWPSYESDRLGSANGQLVEMPWSFRSRSVEPGDRLFLLRQRDHRGVIASGRVNSSPFESSHWNSQTDDRRTTYVTAQWDTVLGLDDRLPLEDLLTTVPDHHWNQTYSSGQEVKPPSDTQLERRWADHLAVVARSTYWDIEPGAIVTRAEVAGRYGGSTQGGIQPSARTPNIMIYSDPATGHAHGYNYDGPADGAYYYTGEGQLGDQQLRAGNAAVLDHVIHGRTLRLFEAAGPTRPGGKPQRYLGAYAVDPEHPYRREPAPDREGNSRSVIVFRLIPSGPTIDSNVDTTTNAPSVPADVQIVASETNTVDSFEVAATDTREGQRWEASLMRQVEDHLRAQGHELGRIRISPAGEASAMVTDTYDKTEAELFELKPTASRAHIRAAVAQLLDYRRHIPDLQRATVLVPSTPSADLQDYVRSAGLDVAVFHDNEIKRLAVP